MKKIIFPIFIIFINVISLFSNNWKSISEVDKSRVNISSLNVVFFLDKNKDKMIYAINQKDQISVYEYLELLKYFKKNRFFKTPIIKNKITFSMIPKLNVYYVEDLEIRVDAPSPICVSLINKRVYRFGYRYLELCELLFGSIRKIDIQYFNKMINSLKIDSIENANDALDICTLFIKIASYYTKEVLFKNRIDEMQNQYRLDNKPFPKSIHEPIYITNDDGYELEFITGLIGPEKWIFTVSRKGKIELKSLIQIE